SRGNRCGRWRCGRNDWNLRRFARRENKSITYRPCSMKTRDLARCPLDLVWTLWGGFLRFGLCPDLDLVTMDPLPCGQTLNLGTDASTLDGFPAFGTLSRPRSPDRDHLPRRSSVRSGTDAFTRGIPPSRERCPAFCGRLLSRQRGASYT